MKKFLTVLLVIAVMFTFSFSSAFAATEVSDDAANHAQALALAKAELAKELSSVAAAEKLDLAAKYNSKLADKIDITKDAYVAVIDKYVEDYSKVLDEAVAAVDFAYKDETDVSVLENRIENTMIDDVIVYNGTALSVKFADGVSNIGAAMDRVIEENPSGISGRTLVYLVYFYNQALPQLQAGLNDIIDMIDTTVYTNDVIDKTDAYKTTYAQKAAKEIAAMQKVVAETEVALTDDATTAMEAVEDMYDAVFDAIEPLKEVDTTAGTKVVVSYRLKDVATAEELGIDDVAKEALAKSLLALVEQNASTAYKNALNTYNASAKDAVAKEAFEAAQKQIDAYKAVNTLLINEEEIDAPGELALGNDPCYDNTLVNRVANYEKAAALADSLKLAVEKDGTLTYVASVIDENLADVQIALYKGAPYDADVVKAALTDEAENVDSNFEWEKASVIAYIQKQYADFLDEYEVYAPEKAIADKELQKFIDKINETENHDQLTALFSTYSPDLSKFAIKDAVDHDVAGLVNTGKFIDKVNEYVEYLNYGKTGYDTVAKVNKSDSDEVLAVAEFLAEQGARTEADVAALYSKAQEYALSLPTYGEIKATNDAVDALIKALPKTVTLADKAQVEEAYDAADEAGYGTSDTKLVNAIALVKAAEEKAIGDMIKALPKTLTAADKDAVKALADAVDAYEATDMYASKNDYSDKVTAAENGVRDAVLGDAMKAISALNANSTADEVAAARAAVDAFVAEYDDPATGYQAIAKVANLDKLVAAEAAAAKEAEKEAAVKDEADNNVKDVIANIGVLKLNGKKMSDGRTAFSFGDKSTAKLQAIEDMGYQLQFSYYKAEGSADKPFKFMSKKVKSAYDSKYPNYRMIPTKGTYGTKYIYTAQIDVLDANGAIVATIAKEDVQTGWAVWRKK